VVALSSGHVDGDKDMYELHIKAIDAMDRIKWRGKAIIETIVIVTVM